MSKSLKNQSGQTSVEYILLLVAIVAMMLSVFRVMKDRMFADQGACTQASTSMVCNFEKIWSGRFGSGGTACSYPFRCYPLDGS